MIKKTLLILSILSLSVYSYASADTLSSQTRIDSLTNRIIAIEAQNEILNKNNDELRRRLSIVENTLNALQGRSESIEARVSENEKGLATNESTINETKAGLSEQIKATDDKVSGQESNLKKKTIWGIIIAALVLAISAILTYLFNKKGNAKIADLQGKADKLNEEIVNRLSGELGELQNISASLSSLSSVGASSQNEQDLIKALADRITFMEMTLYRMDSNVRGYSHLKRSISQMKDNLKANGYELVEMLGKPYSDGMKATVSFDDDENLPEGTRVITKIIKPQINYNGVMIQSAQITVSQNI